VNFIALNPLTATGSDQAVSVPRGYHLIIRAVDGDVELRHQTGAAAKLTFPLGTLASLGPSLGQTVYVKATAGVTIELALT